MSFYTVNGSVAPASTVSPLNLTGGTTVRLRLATLCFSTTGVPTSDQGVDMKVQRSTTAGTGTSVTPRPNDSASVAAVATALSALTAEPTYTANSDVLRRAFNPRATVQWAAYDPRAEIITPATAANGVGAQIVTPGGAATLVVVEAGWYE